MELTGNYKRNSSARNFCDYELFIQGFVLHGENMVIESQFSGSYKENLSNSTCSIVHVKKIKILLKGLLHTYLIRFPNNLLPYLERKSKCFEFTQERNFCLFFPICLIKCYLCLQVFSHILKNKVAKSQKSKILLLFSRNKASSVPKKQARL